MLVAMVERKAQKGTHGGYCFPAHSAKPDSHRDRWKEMPSTARKHGYLTAMFLCSLLLTFAQATAQSREEIHVSFAERLQSEGESAKSRLRRMLG